MRRDAVGADVVLRQPPEARVGLLDERAVARASRARAAAACGLVVRQRQVDDVVRAPRRELLALGRRDHVVGRRDERLERAGALAVAEGAKRLDLGHGAGAYHPCSDLDSAGERDCCARRGPGRRGRLRGRAQGAAAHEGRLAVPRARARRPERPDRGARLERRRAARRPLRRGRRGARARPGRAVPRPAAARRALARGRPRRTRRAWRRRCGATPTSWTAFSSSWPTRSPTRACARRCGAFVDGRGPADGAARRCRPPRRTMATRAGCSSTRSAWRRSAARPRSCTRACARTSLLAAALLHDVGRTLELGRGPAFRADRGGPAARPRPSRAAADRGARRGAGDEVRAELLHAVAVHHEARAARTAEAAVLYHANQLDAVAATRPVE